MNRDIQVDKGSDCILRFEFLGEDNAPYPFNANLDWLQIELEDIAGELPSTPINISLDDFENPVSVKIPWDLLVTFNNPIKYKMVLSKPDFQLVLLSGYILCQ